MHPIIHSLNSTLSLFISTQYIYLNHLSFYIHNHYNSSFITYYPIYHTSLHYYFFHFFPYSIHFILIYYYIQSDCLYLTHPYILHNLPISCLFHLVRSSYFAHLIKYLVFSCLYIILKKMIVNYLHQNYYLTNPFVLNMHLWYSNIVFLILVNIFDTIPMC